MFYLNMDNRFLSLTHQLKNLSKRLRWCVVNEGGKYLPPCVGTRECLIMRDYFILQYIWVGLFHNMAFPMEKRYLTKLLAWYWCCFFFLILQNSSKFPSIRFSREIVNRSRWPVNKQVRKKLGQYSVLQKWVLRISYNLWDTVYDPFI